VWIVGRQPSLIVESLDDFRYDRNYDRKPRTALVLRRRVIVSSMVNSGGGWQTMFSGLRHIALLSTLRTE
jgi:hypothetical protein